MKKKTEEKDVFAYLRERPREMMKSICCALVSFVGILLMCVACLRSSLILVGIGLVIALTGVVIEVKRKNKKLL